MRHHCAVHGTIRLLACVSALVLLDCARQDRVSFAPEVAVVVGEAALVRGGAEPVALAPGEVLSVGEIVDIPERSKAKFSIGAGNALYALGPCRFSVQALDQRNHAKSVLHLKTVFGEFYCVLREFPAEGVFAVQTPNATVFARASRFGLTADTSGSSTAVFVVSGVVHVGGCGEKPVAVGANGAITVSGEKNACIPRQLTNAFLGRLKSWVGATAVEPGESAPGQPDTLARNLPPRWFGAQKTRAYVGVPFVDTLHAEDPEKACLSYHLARGPDGMDVDSASGILSFVPGRKGSCVVRVLARDPQGAQAELEYVLNAAGGLQAVLLVPEQVLPNREVALDASQSVSRSGRHDGMMYRFDAGGDGTWDYPSNGGFGPDAVVYHRFDKEGTVPVLLEVRDSDGKTAKTTRTVGVAVANQPPVARIRVNPSAGAVNQMISFDALQSTDSRDPPDALTVRWDLDGNGVWDYPQGDGFTSDKQIANLWDSVGTYRVCVEVRDSQGALSKACAAVTVGKGVVIDDLRCPDTVTAGQSVPVECRAVSDGFSIREYAWDFDGDGSIDKRVLSAQTEAVFRNPGAVRLLCTATDDNGFAGQSSKRVVVLADHLVVEAGGPYSAAANKPFTVAAVGAGQARAIAECAWDFDGDGAFDWTSKKPQSASHTYAKSGVYAATYRVTGTGGQVALDTAQVTVVNSPPVARAGADMPSEANRKVLLAGHGSDADGAIVRYEWDFEGDGVYDWSSADTGYVYHAFAQAARPVLRVTDSDGATAQDTVLVLVCPDDMVLVGKGMFCIDVYEWPNRKGMLPEAAVSYPDAQSACRAAGKRLCEPAEWETACRGRRGQAYPYGTSYTVDKCNNQGNAFVKGELARSGFFQNCRGDWGIFDMSGNVAEWTDGGEGSRRAAYGGAYQTSPNTGTCSSRILLESSRKYFYVGFRCCK